MERILLRNGIPEPMPRIEGTYLYQTLHVRGRRPLWLDRHTELLARNIQELFGLRWAPDLRRLEAEIAALLDATCVAEFTFYLAIPVMAGASLLKVVKFAVSGVSITGTEIAVLLVGCVVAFVVSLAAIRFLMDYVKRHDFKFFGIYRIVLGAIVLAVAAITALA